MDTQTLKSGTCPKCNSTEVYTDESKPKVGQGRVQLCISVVARFYLDTYICTNCGHFEEYIDQEDLKKKQESIERIKKNCKKLK